MVKTRAGLPDLPGECLDPGDRHHRLVLRARHSGVGRAHPLEHLAQDQRLAVAGQRQANAVDVGRAPDVAVLDSAEDRVPLFPRGDDAAGALLAVVAVVVDPGLAQYLPAEPAVPLLARPRVARVGLAGLEC